MPETIVTTDNNTRIETTPVAWAGPITVYRRKAIQLATHTTTVRYYVVDGRGRTISALESDRHRAMSIAIDARLGR